MAQRILLVEDNRDLADLLGLFLRGAGYEVSQAESSADGIKRAIIEQPDLILTDLCLPGMDGLEATEKLKQDQVTSSIPIVLLTAMPTEIWRAKALKAGVAGYLIKPISPAVLLDAVSRLIRHPSLLTER